MFRSIYSPVIFLFLTAFPTVTWGRIDIRVSPTASSNLTIEDWEKQTGISVSLSLALAILKSPAVRNPEGQLKDSVRISLDPGMYRLIEPITLDAASSGNNTYPVMIDGPDGGTAVISGGKAVIGFSPVVDPNALARLPVAARKHVLRVNIAKQGITDFGQITRLGFDRPIVPTLEIFFKGQPMVLARWPNSNVGFAKIASIPDGANGRKFSVQHADVTKWQGESNVLATGYWFHPWADETIPLESIDSKTGVITLPAPGHKYGLKLGQPVFIQNALSELDQPGEWYLDRQTGDLYFWPPELIRDGDVQASVLPSLVVTKGVSHIRFSRVTFELARGDAISIVGGSGVTIERATIRNVGGRAARAEGTGHRFLDVDVYNSGQGGIYIWGGNRQTLVAAGLAVENSRIRQFARLSRTYRPGIQMGGVGNRVMGNVISDAPHSAIIFYGNDHLIAFNEISRVAKETGDVGAILIGRDWTARGTIIRNNYLHDINGPGLHGSRGVYLDDQASGIVVRSNLFVRVDQAIFIGGGRDNLIEENLIVSSTPAIHVDARGLSWQRASTADPKWYLRQRLSEVPYNRPPYRDRYPNLASILEDEPGTPKYNVIRRNVVVGGQPIRFLDGADRWTNVESMIESGVSLFQAPPKTERPTDFSIRAIPPVKDFTPLPLEMMGCVSSRWQQADAGKALANCQLH